MRFGFKIILFYNLHPKVLALRMAFLSKVSRATAFTHSESISPFSRGFMFRIVLIGVFYGALFFGRKCLFGNEKRFILYN